MKRLVVLGLDLAGSPRRPTGVCLLRALAAETRILFADEEIDSFAFQTGPDLVTVDAPLNLPPGRLSFEDRNGEHYRPCDLELRAHGIPFFPITLGPMRALTLRGIALKNKLERRGIRVLEMYPGGAQDLWGIPRAKRDEDGLRAELARLGVTGLRPGISDHELDAATGALVGRLYLQKRACVFGDFETGAILMPKTNAEAERRPRTARFAKSPRKGSGAR